MTVEWDQLGQPGFDRAVEALVRDRFGARVRAVNGRGGDGGVDIEVTLEYGLVWIIQLKYYKDGFSGGFVKRRQEIKKSYARALGHGPAMWSLVVPWLCTTPEDAFVKGLNAGDSSPLITVIDRDDLDVWMADAPHIEASVLRTASSEMERLARIYSQERAALLGGVTDVLSRVRDLGSVVNTLDAEWAVGFATRATGGSSVTVQPRHPGAPVSNPIRFAVTLDELDPELDRALLNSFGYGTSETIVLPADVVRSVQISGGPFVAGEYPAGAVQLVTAPGGPAKGKTLELTSYYDEQDEPPQVFEGVITHSAPGPFGGTIEADFCGGHLSMRLRLPYSISTPPDDAIPAPGLDMSMNYGASRPGVVAEVLSTARLLRLANHVEARVDGQLLTTFTISASDPSDEDCEMVGVEQFAADLDLVQRYTNRYFNMPAEMRPGDRVRMRVARVLTEKYIVASPRVRQLTMEMSGDDSPELRAMLAQREQSIVWPGGMFSETVDGRELPIGDVYVVHPRAVIVNGQEAIAALDSGTARGFEVIVEPADTPYFYLTLADTDADEVHKRYLAAWTLYNVEQPGLPPALAAQE